MPAKTLAEVNSWGYILGGDLSDATISAQIGASPYDLVVVGQADHPTTYLNLANPNNSKILLGYVDLSAASEQFEPSLFSGPTLPSWFGKVLPGFPDLHSVQYWNPAWSQLMLATVDKYISNGYNGIFLDSAIGLDWTPGNQVGNPVFDQATADMGNLIETITDYIKSKHLDHPFCVMVNSAVDVAQYDPSTLSGVDIVLNEQIYYSPVNNGVDKSVYVGDLASSYVLSNSSLYAADGLRVFGNEYPFPLNDPAAAIRSFDFYSSRGWIPSIQDAQDTSKILTTGPFMFMATAASATVTGTAGYVNFLSGGLTSSATLIGGPLGDYFVGGPGQNSIKGGAGDDTIYAHPQAAGLRNILDIRFFAHDTSDTNIKISVLINGQTVLPATEVRVTDATPGTAEDFSVDVSRFGGIQQLQIVTSNSQFIDQTHYNAVTVASVTLDGTPIAFGDGTYTSFMVDLGQNIAMNGNGSVTFPSATFSRINPYLANTSDTIDGGGGVNTVLYRGAAAGYNVSTNGDGSFTVTAFHTAEGPDTLTNVQKLAFTDMTVALHPATAGADSLTAVFGNSEIHAGSGNDTVTGAASQNYLRGDDGDDSLLGGAGFDDLNGNMGNDTVATGAGEDYCVGGKDNDSLSGGANDDLVYGNLGDDTCNGDDGNDIVRGGQGNDVVNGGNGDDFVSGDKGDDTMTGGAGADQFHSFSGAGIDRVLDFHLAEGDQVRLDPGTTYTVSQVGSDTVIDMSGGSAVILAGLQMSSLTGNWIFVG